jgi:hypothetical protein
MAKKAVTVNPFDAIAQPKGKKASSPKVYAEVTDEIKQTVDNFITTHADLERKKSELKILSDAITNHVRPQQDSKARENEFTKSLYV